MGFLRGSISIKRYFIEDIDVFKNNKEGLLALVNKNIFRPIDNEGIEEQVGWVSPFKIYQPVINYEDMFLDRFVYFAMRVDTKSVPKTLIEANALETIEKENLQIKSKKQLKDLKDDIKQKLLVRALPSPKIIEGIIDTTLSTLFVNSSSKKQNGYFLSLFGKTFDMKPTHINSTMFGFLSVKKPELIEKLATTEETYFNED
jgi:DNA recombination-dependent growth factor C